MVAGRPRKYDKPQIIAGKVPGYKKDILDIFKITPTEIITTGMNYTLEQLISQGKVKKEVFEIYISSLYQEISELQEKIQRAERVRDRLVEQVRRESEQITVWDITTWEKVTIPRSAYEPEKHAMIAGSI